MGVMDVGPEILRRLIQVEAFRDISSLCATNDDFNAMCESIGAMSVWKSELVARCKRDGQFLMMVSDEYPQPKSKMEYIKNLAPSEAPSVYKAICIRILHTSIRENMDEYFWGEDNLSDHLEELLMHHNLQYKHLMEIIVSTFVTGFQEPDRYEKFKNRLPNLLNLLVTPLTNRNLLLLYSATNETLSRVKRDRCFIYQQFLSWLNEIHDQIGRSHCSE